jgi:hypothetical protein
LTARLSSGVSAKIGGKRSYRIPIRDFWAEVHYFYLRRGSSVATQRIAVVLEKSDRLFGQIIKMLQLLFSFLVAFSCRIKLPDLCPFAQGRMEVFTGVRVEPFCETHVLRDYKFQSIVLFKLESRQQNSR